METYRNPVRKRRSGNRRRSEASCTGIRYAGRIWERAAIGRKLYRNPVRKEDLGIGNDRKKVVPESGTQRGSGNRQQSEESCTGIRYAERVWEQAAIERELYRNPVRKREFCFDACFDATGKAVNIFDYIENICYIE